MLLLLRGRGCKRELNYSRNSVYYLIVLSVERVSYYFEVARIFDLVLSFKDFYISLYSFPFLTVSERIGLAADLGLNDCLLLSYDDFLSDELLFDCC